MRKRATRLKAIDTKEKQLNRDAEDAQTAYNADLQEQYGKLAAKVSGDTEEVRQRQRLYASARRQQPAEQCDVGEPEHRRDRGCGCGLQHVFRRGRTTAFRSCGGGSSAHDASGNSRSRLPPNRNLLIEGFFDGPLRSAKEEALTSLFFAFGFPVNQNVCGKTCGSPVKSVGESSSELLVRQRRDWPSIG